MKNDNRPIGIFDSGLGGLTAVTCISQMMPNERFIYFGDTARTPYGSKSLDNIKKFSLQITDFLVERGAKVIVIACNTVSATCINDLRKRYLDIPVLGIIEPTAKIVAEEYVDSKRIGVIGTKVTVDSKQYQILIKSINKNCKVYSKACPLFVPMIEEGMKDIYIKRDIVRYYLDLFLKENNITDLILGCTHYPLLQDIIEDLYPKLRIINPSEIIAEKTKDILTNGNMLAEKNNIKSHFYASDLSESFVSMIDSILPESKLR